MYKVSLGDNSIFDIKNYSGYKEYFIQVKTRNSNFTDYLVFKNYVYSYKNIYSVVIIYFEKF